MQVDNNTELQQVVPQKQDIKTTISNSINNLQSMWNIPQQHMAIINPQQGVARSIKHGLLSGIPIVCKVDKCPYINTCNMQPQDRILNARCPVEIATLVSRFEQICTELDISEADPSDLGQVKELVDLEVMMLRCDHRLADSADILQKSVKDVAKNGVILYEYKVDPAAEFKLSLIEKHSKILKDLNATRSSKKEKVGDSDPSLIAANLIRKAKEIEEKLRNEHIEVVESDYVDVDDNVVEEDGEKFCY